MHTSHPGHFSDRADSQDLQICARQGQGEETHCQGSKEQWVPITARASELVHNIQPLPADLIDPPRATIMIQYIQNLSESIQRILAP